LPMTTGDMHPWPPLATPPVRDVLCHTRRFAVDVDENRRYSGTLVLSEFQQLVADIALRPSITHCFQLKSKGSCIRTAGSQWWRPTTERSICSQSSNVEYCVCVTSYERQGRLFYKDEHSGQVIIRREDRKV